jgi:hypothetical protein
MPASVENLSGLQRKILHEAILDAFNRNELRALFIEDIGKNFDHYVSESSYMTQVYEVIDASQKEGWTSGLLDAIKRARSNNRYISRLNTTLDLMSPTGVPPRPGDDEDEMPGSAQLERLVLDSGKIVDFAQYLQIQARICRIEGKNSVGTGFLVADDLVLTNYHVIEKETAAGDVICRFDYSSLNNESAKGRVSRFSADWIVDHSRYADGDARIDGAAPDPNTLDFALLRLAEAVGCDMVGGYRRGFMQFAEDVKPLAPGQLVQIVQHPKGRPLAMSMGKVIDYDARKVRVRYNASTEPGSSGAPVFSADLSIVALHHAGDPNWKRAAEYNQGIPISLIMERVRSKLGAGPHVPLPPPPPPPAKPERIVVLGEPQLPADARAVEAIDAIQANLEAYHDNVEFWANGWRQADSLSQAQIETILPRQPLFVRTVVDPEISFADAKRDLNYKLLRKFGFELDVEHPSKAALDACARVLWRPGGPAWDCDSPDEHVFAREDAAQNFASWLADLIGFVAPDPSAVIQCEVPKTDWAHAQKIRNAVETGLTKAFGHDPEPDRRIFAPGGLRQVLKKIPESSIGIVAVSDFRVTEPATADKAIIEFRKLDKDILTTVGDRKNLLRVAVLVRTADEFDGDLEFNAFARLPDWLLLRVRPSREYKPDDDNLEYIREKIASLRNDVQPAEGAAP